MHIEIQLTNIDTSYIIKNLYPLYLHDLSGHYGHLPNQHGIYEDTDDVKTLSEQYEVQNIWWEKPGVLFPYLIRVDERPAGFILIATPPYCNKGIDYFVNEFFLLQPYRGKGIAEKAAHLVFDQHRGKWELFTNHLEANIAGQKFWRRAVCTYTNGNYIEELGETFDGMKLIFRFDNLHE
ncbi:GNAT family N-acetyltransferase [Anaerobacillus alkaliphilus]|uniref:GNAT family N-acetyltransferase n=1 Tax=Anaerobacillus alkaliphilus TaxID=1548597 RepID=A0A4Q0VXN5_9BACI|nr:GNAT family N-acetyltransferase [Anaerobacillus alkaliphilus]RXJ04513.1 GNAT family N-acetyltransferase [Anaerobacillus alkaliphilus]